MGQKSVSKINVDDLYLAIFGENEEEIFPVSDSEYAEELQFQEALLASTISFQMTKDQTVEEGESSSSFCEICAEMKESYEMFRIESCIHSYCYECIIRHVNTKLQDNITTVTCPGLNCKSVLEFDTCRRLLPKVVVELWEEALCGELIDVSQRFYCPFKDCSAMLVKDNDGEVIRSSECPICRRLFCAQCSVTWHEGIACEEYQRLNEDEKGREDLMLRDLAKENKWRRCPKCKFFVERTEGCPHMICRCKFQFCYGCGSEWTPNHGCPTTSQTDV